MLDRILYGRKRELSLPNGEKRTAKYVIVDLDDIIASHNEETFSSSEGYPVNEFGRNINDRNYKDDPAAQQQVIKIAQDLEPERLVELSSKASGTPIINPDGIVLSGNNRVMSLKLAAKKFPHSYEQYLKYLAAEIEIFGFAAFIGPSLLLHEWIPLPGSSFDHPQTVKFNHPVLVRIDQDSHELSTTELAKYNLDTRKGERPVDRSIKLANILRENALCRQAILNTIDGFETFSELYGPAASNDRKKLLTNFVDCGLIPTAKLPEYYNDGEFTETGKDFIESVLSALVLTPDALLVAGAHGVRKLRQVILSTLPILITNKNLPEGSLQEYISQAIVYQYRLIKVGDFADFLLNRQLFEDAPVNVKSIYLNRLMNVGRNNFKEAIAHYNTSVMHNAGESLFTADKPGLEEIFQQTIIAAIPAHDAELIRTAILANKITEAMPKETAIPSIVNIESIDHYAALNIISNDAFFKNNPDKVLGVPTESSGRFGPVIRYNGDLSDLERIAVPMDFIGNAKTLNNPFLSTDETILVSPTALEPAVQQFLKKINEKSSRDVGEKLRDKQTRKKKGEAIEEQLSPELPELVTFEDMYRRYNPEISNDELEVFLWYKTQLGKPLARRWVNLLEERFYNNLSDPEPYHVGEEKLSEWINAGLLYYYSGNYLPAFLYLSGDIYARKMQLERDKDDIVFLHGLNIYMQQEAALTGVFKVKYDARLLVSAENSEAGLIILPNSKFAENFFVGQIASIEEESGFLIRKVTASSSKKYGRPDFLRAPETAKGKNEKFEKLSLKDAFAFWLIKTSPEIGENVTIHDIVKYYLEGTPIKMGESKAITKTEEEAEKSQLAKLKASLQKEGERLFKMFLDQELIEEDKVRLETEWNAKFNNHVPVDTNKVPVAFTMAKYYKGKIEQLRNEKRQAVAFIFDTGVGCIAYDVGVGKTPSAIFTISAFLDAGYAKRPFVCVPNQVYKQFIQEIKDFTPHIPILEAYNFGEGYVENFKDANGNITQVPEGCITVMTYEGLEKIGFNDNTFNQLYDELYTILDQGGESKKRPTQRQQEGFAERLKTILGQGLRGSLFNIEDFGFDFGCYDEAHKLKKIFTSVKGEAVSDAKGTTTRGKNPYVITSGAPSSIGLKAFMLNQYILKQSGYQNILLLTATPFTNSPLEIFSMLAMLAYEQLQATDLNNLKNFFDTYIQTSTDLVINPKLKPEFKQVILGFNNLISLQTLIRRYILYKTGEEVNVQRPNAYILPYTHKLVNGTLITLGEAEKVETFLPMTAQQKSMMDDIVRYVEGKISLSELGNAAYKPEAEEETEGDEAIAIGEEIDEGALSDDDRKGVRYLRGMNFARNLAVSPYLYEYSGLGKPDYFEYVQTSPKLLYICRCIKSVKLYHEAKGEPVSGQVIYLDRGIEYFSLIKEYLVREVGYKPYEVAIIKSGLPAGIKAGSKEYIKNLFNGEMYNISTKLFVPVPDSERIKVIIGSSTIKEGINLQRYSSCLYDAWQDWNPTDFLQKKGRIWRQGNVFQSVRIVCPLVVDSMDIFIFQKLQEKTARLNTIWSTDGRRNMLRLEEFNPEELKYALIRDPKTVAELKVIDQTSALESEILGIRRISDRITRIKEEVKRFNQQYNEVIQLADKYRTFRVSGDKLKDAHQAIVLVNDVLKNQTDKEGLKMVYRYDRQNLPRGKAVSTLDPFYKPYWFDSFVSAERYLQREIRDFINPRGINFSLEDIGSLDHYENEENEKVNAFKKEMELLRSEKNIDAIAQQVISERIAKKIEYKPLLEVVADFERLNYLLDHKIVASRIEKPIFDTCPPRENGQLAISDEAVIFLDKCLEKEAQTKFLHTDPEGQYKPDRLTLHDNIIQHLFKNVRCVKRGSPIAVFTGGSPGAGKTHFLREHAEYLLSPDVFHLDADEIRAMLPEYKGWNANATHQESQDIVNKVLEIIGEGQCRYDFIYDGTMNRANRYFQLIKKAKDLGYQTFIIFMVIPFGIAKKRVLDRYQRTGRYVPMKVLEDFHQVLPSGRSRGQDALDLLKPVVDGFLIVDGQTGKIMQHQGVELPKDRQYGKLLNKPQPEQLVTEPVVETIQSDKEIVQDYIDILNLSLKYLTGPDKKMAQESIETMQISLKYLITKAE